MKAFLRKVGVLIMYSALLGVVFGSDYIQLSWAAEWVPIFYSILLILGFFLIWNHQNTIDMAKASLHEYRIEARGFWFILKTQPLWFSALIVPYMFLWRIPVATVLGTIALIIAMLAISVRWLYGVIAPQIQSTWVPKQDDYTRAVRVYYAKRESEYEARKGRAERKAAKKARKTGGKKDNVTKIDKHMRKTNR